MSPVDKPAESKMRSRPHRFEPNPDHPKSGLCRWCSGRYDDIQHVIQPAESAVERYFALEWVPDGEMGFDPGGREVKAAADAALAELKSKLAAAEERVRELKGQDCASCSHTTQDTALYPPPPPNYEVYSYCGCPDSPCYMRVITPVDRCAHWSARLTAPEPKEETVNDGLCRASVPDHDDPYFSERPCTRKAMSGGYCWQHALTRSETMSAENTDKLTAAIDRLTDAGYPTNDIAPLVSARDNLKGWTAGGHPTTSLLIDGVTNLVALLAEHEDLCKREHQMSARLTAPEPKEEPPGGIR